MRTKTAPVQVKAGEEDGLESGQFEALVSVFNNVDMMGDRVMPGAFGKTLAEWEEKGDPIPVLWSHRAEDPDYHIGVVLEAEERDEGLWIKGQLDLDAPKAAQTYRLLKARRVTQFSFAYDINDGGWADKADENDRDVYELRDLKLYEVGPTLIGANQDTELLDVKTGQRPAPVLTLDQHGYLRGALGKVGRTLSSKNEQKIRDAIKSLQDVLAALGDEEDEDGKAAEETVSANDEDRESGKSEEPTGPSPARARLYAEIETLDLG